MLTPNCGASERMLLGNTLVSQNETPTSKIPTYLGVLVACLICMGLGTVFLKDLPGQLGFADASVAYHDSHDHDSHDNDSHDHDHDDHSSHADQDHTGHDHGGNDHSGHDHATHADDTAAIEGSLPPFTLDDDAVSSDVSQAHFDHSDHAHHDHSEHATSADGHEHSDETSIELSPQARHNLRLEVKPAELGTFTKYVDVPGVISDWPGRTHIDVTSPLTGVINAIKVSQGELIRNGTPLFSLRLTHQDLVKTQEQFLAQLGQRDVEEREIERLSAIASSGAVAGKTLLNRKYERDKLLANLRAARQSLLLHGLTLEQIDRIEKKRELVREVMVYAPELHEDDSLHHDSQIDHAWKTEDNHSHIKLAAHNQAADHSHADRSDDVHVDVEFLVTALDVNRGQSVNAGERLTRLSDYRFVLIEGHAFQRDSEVLRKAATDGLPLQAVLDATGSQPELIDGLRIVNIGNEIDRQTRALPFFVSLSNEVERSEHRGKKHYASWKYKPGQRLKVRIPTHSLDSVFVVPIDAVAQQGAERYLFVQNGGHFDRVAVNVVADDSLHAAIANDGQIRQGQRIAVRGASRLQTAMSSKAGGTVDPHAGHAH
jgi:multidrug efflux pump subunit AcrA (membrane-fusion protein)